MSRLGLGAMGIAVSTFGEAMRRRNGAETRPPAVDGVLRLLPGALLGMAFEFERRMLGASAAVEVRVIQVSAVVSRRLPVPPHSAMERSLVRWSERGHAEQTRNELVMAELVRQLAPELAEAIVARLP